MKTRVQMAWEGSLGNFDSTEVWYIPTILVRLNQSTHYHLSGMGTGAIWDANHESEDTIC